MPRTTHAVTGAFGYSGRYIAERLLTRGHEVITLTNSTGRSSPLAKRVQAVPFRFDHPDRLAKSLEGVDVLYNTYWVRFNHKMFTHADAVRNTETMFNAAKQAGVRRIVHVSITNPSEDSPLEYFSGKGRLERALKETGVSHAILRPTVLFGREDILINNIAWALRRFPAFAIFGDGKYRLQPIHVDDLAKLAVEQGELIEDATIEAIGPETFTYEEMVRMIAEKIGARRLLMHVPPWMGYRMGQAISLMTGDVMITREEIRGLMDDLLYVDAPPAGETALTDWTERHADTLGKRYASELARRRDRSMAYVEEQ